MNRENPFSSIKRQIWEDLSQMVIWVSQWLNKMLILFLGNSQTSAQARFSISISFFMIIWLIISQLFHPFRCRVEFGQTWLSAFMSLFAPDVFGFLLILVLPFFLILRLAAFYLDDIFELGNINLATKYILQSTFAIRYPTITIREGEVDTDDLNNPLFRIGGPGYVKIHMENVVIFEQIDGKARVVHPSLLPQEDKILTKNNNFNKSFFWLLGFSFGAFIFYHSSQGLLLCQTQTGNLEGIISYLCTGFSYGISSIIFGWLISILLDSLLCGIIINFVKKISVQIIPAIFITSFVAMLSGFLCLLIGGLMGAVISSLVGVILLWISPPEQPLATLLGFEKIKAIIDLRPQKKVLKPIRTRTRDGVEVLVEGVQIFFHVFRNNQTELTFNTISILNLVYNEGKLHWTENTENRISVLLRTIINQTDLFDLLSSNVQDPQMDQPHFVMRETIQNKIMEYFNRDSYSKGVQLEWIGLGSWTPALPQVENDLLALWQTNNQSNSNIQMQSFNQRYDELARLISQPVEILNRYQEKEQVKLQLGTYVTDITESKEPSPEQIKKEILFMFREKVFDGLKNYQKTNSHPPKIMVKTLEFLDYLIRTKLNKPRNNYL